MKKVAIFTDFINFDEAYSLCRVVKNQVKMLVENGYKPMLLVRKGFNHSQFFPGADIKILDHGETGSNTVKITGQSEGDIQGLVEQIEKCLSDVDVILTHDLIYQANMWKAQVAARRFASKNPDKKWLHWVHSATGHNVARQVGKFRNELKGKFPNSLLVAMHPEEINRKGGMYGYEQDEIVIIPNSLDLTEYYHPMAAKIIEKADLVNQDIIAVYPARLDRGKQPHIICEIFKELAGMGYRAKVIIVDFHSVSGDKEKYRKEIKKEFGDVVFFSSDIEKYCIPHQAVMNLFEYADILIHPSRSESDPLILPEAAWQRCGLVLNFDLPLFRQYDGQALLYKFSSNIDTVTGQSGETNTEYADRADYMRHVAAGVAYQMENNAQLKNHARMRHERSLEAVWKKLWGAIER